MHLVHSDTVLEHLASDQNQRAEVVDWSAIRSQFVGLDAKVPLHNGGEHSYVNLDNAATTPPFQQVLDTICEFSRWYSSVHRGTGYKSQLSTHFYEQCRNIVAAFVGASTAERAVIFCANTTQAINILARRIRLQPGQRILATVMEHHSNMLPWRLLMHQVDYVKVTNAEGALDLDDFEKQLREAHGAIPLVAITGASNVTGCMPPLARIAAIAHQYGAQFLVDGAQLVPHRKIEMGKPGESESIDFLVFSGHKMYAPFGTGVLIGPHKFFQQGPPAMPGGGTVRLVTMEDIIWADSPELEEAGSPNVIGAVALAKSCQILDSIGMDRIAEHERELTWRLLEGLLEIEGLHLYGQLVRKEGCDRVGVVPMSVDGLEHGLLAACLSYEYGVGVRHGCFCAHPYVMHLNDVTLAGAQEYTQRARSGDFSRMPGFVRASLGIYNTCDEIDYLIEALRAIVKNGPGATYILKDGEYSPASSQARYPDKFSF